MTDTFFDQAIDFARDQMGQTFPNPAVGCVVVSPNQRVLATGATQKGGRPHAEIHALEKINFKANQATLYVTLEPCCHSHTDKPLSCVEGIIRSGISKVVYGSGDPDLRVKGQGILKLKSAGIQIERPSEEHIKACQDIVAGHYARILFKRPYVTLKIAKSANDVIGVEQVQKEQITGDLAQKQTHYLRSISDAVVVGRATLLADDPLLTNRFGNKQPDRFVISRTQGFKIPERAAMLQDKNLNMPEALIADDIPAVLSQLYQRGYSRVLVESGAGLANAFLQAGLVDQLILLQSNKIVTGKTIPVTRIEMKEFSLWDKIHFGDDVYQDFRKL